MLALAPEAAVIATPAALLLLEAAVQISPGMLSSMPRNVVTLAPRLIRLARPGTRSAIEAALAQKFRYRCENDRIEIDFPKWDGEARRKVITALDEIDPRWRRVFVIYPHE